MTRVNVTGPAGKLAGHFDPAAAKGRWSDKDPITGNGSGGPGRGQAVILTASGRWVLEHWTNWQGEQDAYHWISLDAAREWLLSNHYDEAVEEHFGSVPPEVDLGGRPVSVGGTRRPVQADWEAVDARAQELGVSAAEVVRRALAAYLNS